MVKLDVLAPPYLTRVQSVPERFPQQLAFPFSLGFVAELNLTFRSAVTFFVGENGSGKSTLLEAIAVLNRLPVSGGSRADLAAGHGPEADSKLSLALRPHFTQQAFDGYFLRAELHAHFASLLDARSRDPLFRRTGDPYASYGGQSLHGRSHGEAFLAVAANRFRRGIFLLDEPESALSPQRQLALMTIMADLVKTGASQFIVATHSPILMSFPGATIVSFDEPTLPVVRLEDTEHFRITRDVLRAPSEVWRYIDRPDSPPEE